MIDGMFVFDAHCHAYKPQETVWGKIGATYQEQVARMDRNGIDLSVSMGIYKLTPAGQREESEYTAEAVRAFPDRLIGVSYVTPLWGKDAFDEMAYAKDLGLQGIKLYAPGQGNFPLDSPAVDPIIERVAEYGWFVIIHTDVDSKVANPHLGIRLAKRHPDVTFIFSHMGMNSDATHFIPDYVADTPNIYLDTSDTPNLPEFVYKTPMNVIPDRMLFGTDAPTLSPEVEIKKLLVAEELYGLTKDEKRRILGGNAARLLSIDTTAYGVS
jgi:predicted TIM-barrel fold metal-dependent hydrolase